jgi:hypothetical protein
MLLARAPSWWWWHLPSGSKGRWEEEEKEDDMRGPHVSDSERGAAVDPIHLEPMAFESIRGGYMSSYTPAARSKSFPYVLYDIFVRNKEL